MDFRRFEWCESEHSTDENDSNGNKRKRISERKNKKSVWSKVITCAMCCLLFSILNTGQQLAILWLVCPMEHAQKHMLREHK